jgi:hypothetical protein
VLVVSKDVLATAIIMPPLNIGAFMMVTTGSPKHEF